MGSANETDAVLASGDELSPDDFADVATLHKSALPHGFLGRLGEGFLALLYKCMSESPGCWVIVAKDGGKVVGFVTGALSTGAFYKRFLLRHVIRGGLMVLPHLFSLARIRRVFETLLYPSKEPEDTGSEIEIPSAELLSIAVAPEFRGSGISRRLYQRLDSEFAEAGAGAFKIVVGGELAPARRFYEKMGAVEAKRIFLHKGEESIVLVHCGGAADACGEPPP